MLAAVKAAMSLLPEFDPRTGDPLGWKKNVEIAQTTVTDELNGNFDKAELYFMQTLSNKLRGQAANWFRGKYGYDNLPSCKTFLEDFEEEFMGTAQMTEAWNR